MPATTTTEGFAASVRAATPAEFLSGWLCPKCAKAMAIHSMADCERDDEEAAWGEAQYGGVS